MASDIWLKNILIVRKETCCRHIGYSYRLTARVLLYAHTTAFVTPVVEHWLEREIAQWVHPMTLNSSWYVSTWHLTFPGIYLPDTNSSWYLSTWHWDNSSWYLSTWHLTVPGIYLPDTNSSWYVCTWHLTFPGIYLPDTEIIVPGLLYVSIYLTLTVPVICL